MFSVFFFHFIPSKVTYMTCSNINWSVLAETDKHLGQGTAEVYNV